MINLMILFQLFPLVRMSGAEGSRTLTGWNLNPVPLPLGYGPERQGRLAQGIEVSLTLTHDIGLLLG
jgi:hypothetical protein